MSETPGDENPRDKTAQDDKTVRLDRHLVRALAHPMRNRMLGLLRIYGPQRPPRWRAGSG